MPPPCGQLMEKAVTAAAVNRRFSRLPRAVHSYVVKIHAKVVARVVPFQEDASILRKARAALVQRLRSQPVARVRRWSRKELYEDQED